MLRVGLTGGIGSGKSAVSSLLAAHGAVIIDYDLIARDIVRPGEPALAAIAERFGPDMLAADNTLDRAALGAVVFSDPAALRSLESITHPAIWAEAAREESVAPSDAIVVHDNPLLIEMGADADCDVVVVVDLPTSVQLQRLIAARRMSENDARARIAAQTTRETRTDAADIVVDNTGSLDELARTVGDLWGELASRAAAKA